MRPSSSAAQPSSSRAEVQPSSDFNFRPVQVGGDGLPRIWEHDDLDYIYPQWVQGMTAERVLRLERNVQLLGDELGIELFSSSVAWEEYIESLKRERE